MSEEINLIEKRKTGEEACKIYMYSSRGTVLSYHLKYSILPFINKHKELLHQFFPGGLVLVDASKIIPASSNNKDYYLCFEPKEDDKDLILSSLRNFNFNNCIMINYENTIAYHYRAWRMTNELCSKFKYIFSSASIFADNKKFFWIPNWNFVMNFENGERIHQGNTVIDNKRKLLVINPIRSGFSVSPERLNIIKKILYLLPESEIYGKKEFFEEGHEFFDYRQNHAGEISYSPEPYRFLEKINIFNKYKFSLVIENTFTTGYISEKLAEPLLALSIPIYYGNHNLNVLLPNLSNKALINGHDFSSERDLVNYIKNISDNEYYDYIDRILVHRTEYLEATSRYNIWNYILTKVLLANESANNLIDNINIKFQEANKNINNQTLQNEVIKLIELGNYANSGYENKIRDLFKATT